jgi:large subunit ribosomal protein L22
VAATDTRPAEKPREVRAEAKWVRISPRKARLVAEHIRGRSVPEARTVLAFTPRAAAREIEKVLRSAVANAEANHGLIGDDLVVSAAYIDEGPTIKRWRARARGRVNRIQKRTCHITIKVVQGERRVVAAPPAPQAEQPKRSRRKAAAQAVEPPAVETPVAETSPEEVTATESVEAAAVAESVPAETETETEPVTEPVTEAQAEAEPEETETEQAQSEEKES